MKLTDKIEITNDDNMIMMVLYSDKYFDWACIDPPYGLGNRLSDGGGKLKNTPMAELYRNKEWDILPSAKYWKEVFRISKNQIVFGANYFLEHLPSSRGFVCWDKKKSSTDLERFHPTQKPIYVYRFMFDYCKIQSNDKILDTHLGSGSIAIACHDYGFELTACELDKEYYKKAVERIKNHISQTKLF